jgi:hypothetical protein
MSLVVGKDSWRQYLLPFDQYNIIAHSWYDLYLYVLFTTTCIGQVAHTMVEKQCGIGVRPDIGLSETFGFHSLPCCYGC